MKIQLLGGRILVKPTEKSESKGGIYIPEATRERPQRGEVLAIGGGERLEHGEVVPCQTRAGDVILFSKYAGQEFTLDGLDVLIMLDKEVIMIVDPTRKVSARTAGPAVVDLQQGADDGDEKQDREAEATPTPEEVEHEA